MFHESDGTTTNCKFEVVSLLDVAVVILSHSSCAKFYRMAKDGLWFPIFAKVNPETQVMSEGIWVTGIVGGFMACFVPLEALANLISLGTLMVFTFVDAGVIILRLGNVTEASIEALHHPIEKEREQSSFRRHHRQVVFLLASFTGSLLAASIFLSHSKFLWPIFLLIALAATCGTAIIYTPPSWTAKCHSLSSHHRGSFECPCFPLVPLAGAGFNTFMMGSLPLTSWLLCFVWLAFGITVYFSYGIHHSQLAVRTSQDSDTFPLMTNTGSTTDVKKADYGGTL
jgi:basic amino acid/polyamine antiporter, APA family